MATVSLAKKSAAKKMAAPGVKAAGDAYILLDNEDGSVAVQGTDSAGNPVAIDAVATITATSSDPTVVAVDPPAGMKFVLHALKPTPPGTPAKVTIVATWNDGSAGPFTFTLDCAVSGTVAAGLTVTLSDPVVR